jgi:ketosteroid isomerase-like protein
MLADDVRWTVIGSTKYSGTFKGKQDVMERLAGPLFAELESPGAIEPSNLIAEGEYVVVQATASGRMTRTGRPYNNTYCMVIRLSGGQVTEVDEYCDTELITSAFGTN